MGGGDQVTSDDGVWIIHPECEETQNLNQFESITQVLLKRRARDPSIIQFIFHFHAIFWGKLVKIIRWYLTFGGWRPRLENPASASGPDCFQISILRKSENKYLLQQDRFVFYLAVVKRIPLTPPNVDSATNTGITHHINPYSLWANV